LKGLRIPSTTRRLNTIILSSFGERASVCADPAGCSRAVVSMRKASASSLSIWCKGDEELVAGGVEFMDLFEAQEPE